MEVKVVLLLVGASLVSGSAEADPESINIVMNNGGVEASVDSGDQKQDSYLDIVKTAYGTSFNFVSNLLGEAMGYKCCKVKVAFSHNPVKYVKYENGATDVPCGGRLAGKNGTCVDGNVVCEIDNMGVATNQIILNIVNEHTNEKKEMYLLLVPGSSLFDAMNIAKIDYPKFSFNYTVSEGGVFITTIDGEPEGVPAPMWYWMLWDCTAEPCHLSPTGVSTTYPNNGDIYTWRYQFYNWTAEHH